MTALKNSDALLNGCDFLQPCYDGRVVNKSDRYVFLGQFLLADCKKESVIAVKSFPSGTSVTSEVLFNTITTEACEKLLAKVYSVMADTTAVNTSKKIRGKQTFARLHHGKCGARYSYFGMFISYQ